jgi:hypothetical protein
MIVNICALNLGQPNFIKQALLNTKGQTGPDKTIIGNFSVSLSSAYRTMKKS